MKMRALGIGLAFAALWVVSHAQAFDLMPCVGPAGEVTQGTIQRATPEGVLLLADGRMVVLEGIRLPVSDDAAGRQARKSLLAMVAGRTAKLAVSEPKVDRHGRWRAQVFTGSEWVQETLLREGLARVSLLPSHPECAHPFYAAEAAARAARRGLWALSKYAVRSAQELAHTRGTFQIVEGRVVSARVKQGRAYLNFGNDWRSDFTATVSPEDMKTFRKAHVDPRLYEGKTVRVRGMIGWYHGPEIELMGPESVEIVP